MCNDLAPFFFIFILFCIGVIITVIGAFINWMDGEYAGEIVLAKSFMCIVALALIGLGTFQTIQMIIPFC